MRLQITHLKAPWPPGAAVGDVLDLPGIPLWAVGKCVQVGDDVEASIMASDAEFKPMALDEFREQAFKAFAELKARHAEELEKLRTENETLASKLTGLEQAMAEARRVVSTAVTGDGSGEALPLIATGEGEGAGQPSPGIEEAPTKAKRK